MAEDISRREFVKQTVAGTAIKAGVSTSALQSADVGPTDLNKQVLAALGALFIPSASGDPGFKDLESYGITEYVTQNFPIEAYETFNTAAKQFFDGRTFLELDEKQREQYLDLIINGS